MKHRLSLQLFKIIAEYAANFIKWLVSLFTKRVKQ